MPWESHWAIFPRMRPFDRRSGRIWRNSRDIKKLPYGFGVVAVRRFVVPTGFTDRKPARCLQPKKTKVER